MEHLTVLYLLIAAHFITDFFLQSNAIVKDKNQKKWKSIGLYLHVLCAGLTSYIAFLFVGVRDQWFIPCIILLSHCIIDLIKTYFKKNPLATFIVDQFLHLLVIISCWLVYTSQIQSFYLLTQQALLQSHLVLGLLAYLLLTKPSSVLIGTIVQRWEDKIKFGGENTEKSGLENAGKWIGYLERILLLSFIILDYYEGIGFLFAAKSIFRFGELTKSKERALTEYILIGTLLSFTISILVGMGLNTLTK